MDSVATSHTNRPQSLNLQNLNDGLIDAFRTPNSRRTLSTHKIWILNRLRISPGTHEDSISAGAWKCLPPCERPLHLLNSSEAAFGARQLCGLPVGGEY